MNKNEAKDFDALIGTGSGLINPNSKDFQSLRKIISEQAAQQSIEESMKLQIKGVKCRMESFLNGNAISSVLSIGSFLKELVEIIGVPHKKFAAYIGYKNTNLSALYRGTRRINHDLALKLGYIFDMGPSLWLHVQNKWELIQIQQEKQQEYQQYQLKDLLKKEG